MHEMMVSESVSTIVSEMRVCCAGQPEWPKSRKRMIQPTREPTYSAAADARIPPFQPQHDPPSDASSYCSHFSFHVYLNRGVGVLSLRMRGRRATAVPRAWVRVWR